MDSAAFRPHTMRDTMNVGDVAYLSLGSNLGDRPAYLRAAIAQLEGSCSLRAVSALYETQPVDVPDQPWFLNCVAAIETGKTPRELLRFVLSIEAALGRFRLRDKGPRKIDIDMLLFGDRIVDEPGLVIPHPAMQRRRFVLEPLVEIAPEAHHPVLKKTARELLAALDEPQIVRRVEDTRHNPKTQESAPS
jgi:2-amino-4-hydroxy-6-hydroxymethyldihydropteridine diphosphokinase